MLEEVVRQLYHDLSLAQIQQKATSSQDRGTADASKPQAGANEQEVKALNDRVRNALLQHILYAEHILCTSISQTRLKQNAGQRQILAGPLMHVFCM